MTVPKIAEGRTRTAFSGERRLLKNKLPITKIKTVNNPKYIPTLTAKGDSFQDDFARVRIDGASIRPKLDIARPIGSNSVKRRLRTMPPANVSIIVRRVVLTLFSMGLLNCFTRRSCPTEVPSIKTIVSKAATTVARTAIKPKPNNHLGNNNDKLSSRARFA